MGALRRMALLSIATSIATLALKFGAYYVTGSVSLYSDALEALVNLAAGLVALGALTLSARPPDERHAFGHDKVEYFSSGVEGTLILVAALAIVVAAVGRLTDPQPIEHLTYGLPIALAAAAMNYITARVMLRAAAAHDSIVLEADAKHLLTDVWTSAVVVAGLVVVLFVPRLAIIDALMAIGVGIHIVFTGVDLLRRSADGLMDASLPADEVERAERAIRGELTDGSSFHALRTRKAGSRRFVELHLLVPGSITVADSHALCDRIEGALASALPKLAVTIHVEPRETQSPHR
jgi:cation diffusion facilitator family transporter